ISRRYWGPPLHPRRWLLGASLAWFHFVRAYGPERWSEAMLERAGGYPCRGLRLRRRACRALAVLLAPRLRLREMLPGRLLSPWDRLFERRWRSAGRWGRRATRAEALPWRGFTGLHPDRMI